MKPEIVQNLVQEFVDRADEGDFDNTDVDDTFLDKKKVTDFLFNSISGLLHQELQKAREEERWRIWGELCDIAEPDERQIGAGDLNTHLDDVHKIIFNKETTTVEEKYPLPEHYQWKDSFDALTIKKSSNQSELDQSTEDKEEWVDPIN